MLKKSGTGTRSKWLFKVNAPLYRTETFSEKNKQITAPGQIPHSVNESARIIYKESSFEYTTRRARLIFIK